MSSVSIPLLLYRFGPLELPGEVLWTTRYIFNFLRYNLDSRNGVATCQQFRLRKSCRNTANRKISFLGVSTKTLHLFPHTLLKIFTRFSIFVHDETKKEFLEENSSCPERMKLVEEIAKPAWISLSETSERRFIKTHLPFSLLPPNLLSVGCKVIWVF